jgi:hypothetical protein
MLEAFQAEYPEKSVLFEDLLVDCQSEEMTTDYWFTYVFELFPIARDLTNSMHSGDWILYLSAVETATSLFFFFGRTNFIPAGLLPIKR